MSFVSSVPLWWKPGSWRAALALAARNLLDRYELEIGEVVPLAVVEGQALQAGFGELNGSDVREVPVVITGGWHGKTADGRGFAIQVEAHRVRLIRVQTPRSGRNPGGGR